jgi:Tn3 transposase DDE domain
MATQLLADPLADVRPLLFAVLVAEATNIGLSAMAQSSGIALHELERVYDWYMRGATRSPETLEKAGIGGKAPNFLTKESMWGAIPHRRSERLIAIALP